MTNKKMQLFCNSWLVRTVRKWVVFLQHEAHYKLLIKWHLLKFREYFLLNLEHMHVPNTDLEDLILNNWFRTTVCSLYLGEQEPQAKTYLCKLQRRVELRRS